MKSISEYKALVRRYRYEHDKEQASRFINAKFKRARQYCYMLKESVGMKPANINLSSFEQYFKAVNNPTDPFYTADVLFFNERNENVEFKIMFEELNIKFSNEEIHKTNNQLKPNKSGDPDKLVNDIFIHGRHLFVPTLCSIFNKIYDAGYFQESGRRVL